MRSLKGSGGHAAAIVGAEGEPSQSQDFKMIRLKSILRILETYLLSAFILTSLLAGPLIILVVR
ncbi:hypothetical protein AMC87_CH02615 [Rhizobium phaseoli]|nr:hypothetical protein AMC87_CH02615 [Rhizobium phaseoli]PDS30463.1 hypothetical protein CO650_15740 [Rhizobium phaseoli]